MKNKNNLKGLNVEIEIENIKEFTELLQETRDKLDKLENFEFKIKHTTKK